MIISDVRNNIEMRYRNSENFRVNKTITDFKPYLFIKEGDKMPETITSSSKYGTNRIKPT